jgi:hypothetical protein
VLAPQSALHNRTIFNPYQVVTLEQLKEAFNPNLVEKCNEKDPVVCPKNLNSFLFQGLGLFKYEPQKIINKISMKMANLGVTENELLPLLTDENIYREQLQDSVHQCIRRHISKNGPGP